MQRYVFLVVLALLALRGVAHADAPPPQPTIAVVAVEETVVGHPPAVMYPPPVLERPKTDVYWHDEWPRFSTFELLLSIAVTARNADLGSHLDGPGGALIEFEVPILDHGARDLLRGSTEGRRKAAERLSDVGFRTMVLAPYVVDVAFGALVLHRNPDVALQLALIDFEVLTLAGMTQLLGSRLTGRERPFIAENGCPPGGCARGDAFRSFLSGHAMASFTGAGLMCVHHEMVPLFGGGAPDAAACALALAAASTTGVLRIIGDQHWASDVLLGAGAGWAFGYYLPKLLHFHTKKVAKKMADSGNGSSLMWMPTFAGSPEGATAGIAGTF
ncbi:MAG: uncharacterized protein JWO86_4388 [Myxococcaceae bacterium]|nr:uncharacterized protein [Myxococcaceae bacterium]